MPTLEDIRTIAMAFPETTEREGGQGGGLAWRTRNGGFVWERTPRQTDLRQLAELGRSWPDGTVVGIRTAGLDDAAALIETFPDVFFTIPHFAGFTAVLARIDDADLGLLREVITDAWLLRTTTTLRKRWLAEYPPAAS